jgi:RNA polymerase sigma-70 factor (ECF subfamily)
LPWLYRTAGYQIAHRYRDLNRRARIARAVDVDTDLVANDLASDVVTADLWSTAFASLTEGDREILRLVAWESLTPRAGAATLGCSVAAFKVRLHRARSRLNARLQASAADTGSSAEASRDGLSSESQLSWQLPTGGISAIPILEPTLNAPLARDVALTPKEIRP